MKSTAPVMILAMIMLIQTIPPPSALMSSHAQATVAPAPTPLDVNQPVVVPFIGGWRFNITKFYLWWWCVVFGYCGPDSTFEVVTPQIS